MVGDLAHPLISQTLALGNTEEEEGQEEGMMTPTQPTTTATATTGSEIAPLLTGVEVEVWWSSLTALGHLLTDCLPAKVIVDTSIGLKVFIQLLLPLTRSLPHHGNGSVLRKSARVVEEGVAGATTTNTTATANTTTTANSSNSNSSSSSSMTQPYSNLPLETVPSRPTIISTLLLGTITTTTTTTACLYSHNYNLSIIHPSLSPFLRAAYL